MYGTYYDSENLPKEIPVGRANDLRHLRFGRLEVLYRCNPPEHIKNKSQTYWVCKCDCGKYVAVRTGALTSNGVQSCGCLQREKTLNNTWAKDKPAYNRQDLKGKVFGMLTPLFCLTKNKRAYWFCKCKCGHTKLVVAHRLTSGKVTHCGCQSLSHGALGIRIWLKDHKIDFQEEYSIEDLVGIHGGLLRFDFAIFKQGTLKGFIEYQGEQHYIESNAWHTSELVQHDQKKRDYCKNHNLFLYEIKYNDNLYKTLEDLLMKKQVES